MRVWIEFVIGLLEAFFKKMNLYLPPLIMLSGTIKLNSSVFLYALPTYLLGYD